MKKNTSKDFNESLISYEEDSDHGSLSVNPFDKEIKLLDLPL